jgi:sugar O-acyltransferase (sialic acid O-acetyltransferase NeuD family)
MKNSVKKKKIILIGCEGHAKVCADVILNDKKYQIAGCVCNEKKNSNLLIIGPDKDLKKIRKKYKYALIGVGQIKSSITRRRIFNNLKKLNFTLPVIKSKDSLISNKAKINEGTIIMDGAIIRPDVKIGYNSIINTKAIIEHDVEIGNNTHISTGVIVNGNVKIGNNVFIGSGSIIVNDIKIKSNSFIKAGTTVKENF